MGDWLTRFHFFFFLSGTISIALFPIQGARSRLFLSPLKKHSVHRSLYCSSPEGETIRSWELAHSVSFFFLSFLDDLDSTFSHTGCSFADVLSPEETFGHRSVYCFFLKEKHTRYGNWLTRLIFASPTFLASSAHLSLANGWWFNWDVIPDLETGCGDPEIGVFLFLFISDR